MAFPLTLPTTHPFFTPTPIPSSLSSPFHSCTPIHFRLLPPPHFSHHEISDPNPNPEKPKNPQNPNSHPAFRRSAFRRTKPADLNPTTNSHINISDHGVTYKLENAPFEFQYSYTETPKLKPLALREPPFLPFGPQGMPRPWTGRKPLPKSKKELPEFDSFKLPPHGKKGVKPVQSPGPFLAGAGPKYEAMSREEVHGEPLSKQEIQELVNGSLKTRRQLNMGRDGLTHNMLENIHAHWKRRRVCKIKCKGVCTVDLDNVCKQLEEKVGGKVIFRKGGVIFLFRGRNYNYRTRTRFPLMLWKPVTPVYPRLIKKAPEGLTLEEANEMRNRGRQLLPIRKLAKNGLYIKLVQHVREAFESCDLVRIDCKGLNKSDCKKIGAKLKDLVPCVLIAFEYEHILMWRGKDWKSSLTPLEDNLVEAALCQPASLGTNQILVDGIQDSIVGSSSNEGLNVETPIKDMSLDGDIEKPNGLLKLDFSNHVLASPTSPEKIDRSSSQLYTTCNQNYGSFQEPSASCPGNVVEDSSLKSSCQSNLSCEDGNSEVDETPFDAGVDGLASAKNVDPSRLDSSNSVQLETISGNMAGLEIESKGSSESEDAVKSGQLSMEAVLVLLKQAVESGGALILHDESLDDDVVYQKSVTLAKTAPRGPLFVHKVRKYYIRKDKGEKHAKPDDQKMEVEVSKISETKSDSKKKPRSSRKNVSQQYLSDVVPHGSLRVDELAKLLT